MEERLALRFPRLVALLARVTWRLPFRSRIRRALIRRVVVSAWEGFNREDFDVTFALYHPDVESSYPPQFIPVGFQPRSRGREARVAVQRRVKSEWSQLRFKAEELVEVDHARLLVLGRMQGTGLSSGAVVDNEWATLFTTLDGQVTREQIFFDHREALEAVELPE